VYRFWGEKVNVTILRGLVGMNLPAKSDRGGGRSAFLYPLTFDRRKWQSIVEHLGEEDAAID
jgi:hypothetical protein